MKILLAHGAHPDARDWIEKTPLIQAARHGHLEMVALLLNTGTVSVNAHDKHCQLALSLADK